jgi:hypothetical protein
MSQLSRNRQLILYGTAASLLVSVAARYGVFGSGEPSVVMAHDSIPVAKQRLEILRRKAALVPGKETVLKQVQAELAQREKGIVQEDTSEQARAHLMELLHRTALANGFDTSGAAQLPEPKALGKDYGQVSVGQNFTCGIDQLVNFLSAIANEPEILATDSIFVASARNKNKDIQVRLTFSGVIPKKLVPEKKGLGGL